MRTFLLLTLGVALAVAGCGSDDASDATTGLTDTEGLTETLADATEELPDAIELPLQERDDSGITGNVELSGTTEGQLEVEIELDGSEGGPHPAHIHRGSCDDLDPNPEFPLEDVVDGESKTTLDLSLGDLVLDEYAVNVHESPENLDTYVACADLRNGLR